MIVLLQRTGETHISESRCGAPGEELGSVFTPEELGYWCAVFGDAVEHEIRLLRIGHNRLSKMTNIFTLRSRARTPHSSECGAPTRFSGAYPPVLRTLPFTAVRRDWAHLSLRVAIECSLEGMSADDGFAAVADAHSLKQPLGRIPRNDRCPTMAWSSLGCVARRIRRLSSGAGVLRIYTKPS